MHLPLVEFWNDLGHENPEVLDSQRKHAIYGMCLEAWGFSDIQEVDFASLFTFYVALILLCLYLQSLLTEAVESILSSKATTEREQ